MTQWNVRSSSSIETTVDDWYYHWFFHGYFFIVQCVCSQFFLHLLLKIYFVFWHNEMSVHLVVLKLRSMIDIIIWSFGQNLTQKLQLCQLHDKNTILSVVSKPCNRFFSFFFKNQPKAEAEARRGKKVQECPTGRLQGGSTSSWKSISLG